MDRDRLFWEEKAEIPSINRADLSISKNSDVLPPSPAPDSSNKQVYEGELYRLRRENSSIKEQLQRSLRELKAYQVKYPSAYAPAVEIEDFPQWTSSPEITNPLFTAYDSRMILC